MFKKVKKIIMSFFKQRKRTFLTNNERLIQFACALKEAEKLIETEDYSIDGGYASKRNKTIKQRGENNVGF